MEVGDEGSGLHTIEVSNKVNVRVHHDHLPGAGTKEPVRVTATMEKDGERETFRLRLLDVAGNEGYCTASRSLRF